MSFKEGIEKIKRFLAYKKMMVGMTVITAIALFIRVKISEAPILKIFSTTPIMIEILHKPAEGTVCAEFLNFMDTLGMSFLASLVFLLFTTILPNMEKNKQTRKEIEEIIKEILRDIANITAKRVIFYREKEGAPQKDFSQYTDSDIEWVEDNVHNSVRICLRNNEYITGFQYMHECAKRIKLNVGILRKYYTENLSVEERSILQKLLETWYIKKAELMWIYYNGGTCIKMPEDALKEKKTFQPNLCASSGATVFDDMGKIEIKEGVGVYNEIVKIFDIKGNPNSVLSYTETEF